MGTMVMSGTVMRVGTPSIRNEKLTVMGSAPSTSRCDSVMVKPRM